MIGKLKGIVDSYGEDEANEVFKPIRAFAQQQQWDFSTAHVQGPASEAIASYAREVVGHQQSTPTEGGRGARERPSRQTRISRSRPRDRRSAWSRCGANTSNFATTWLRGCDRSTVCGARCLRVRSTPIPIFQVFWVAEA